MSDSLHQLLDKINRRRATVAVIGLGYAGLPVCLRFAEVGFSTIGVDRDAAKVEHINRGRSYIAHIAAARIAAALQKKNLRASTDPAAVAEADAVILCLPTPLKDNNEPDMHYVLDTADAIAPHLRPGQIVSLESTTYPGATEEDLLPRLARDGLSVGENFFLVFSPEREDPANPDYHTAVIPKICGGVTGRCLQAGVALYGAIVERVVPTSGARAAELSKLLENTYRAVNIALVNELKMLADKMGLDIFEIVRAAATKPFGFTAFHPGPGLGGHCIPIDPFYLSWKARQHGFNARFIQLAGEINTAMPNYVMEKTAAALEAAGKPLAGARILVLGVAYKKNIDDTRESPGLEIISRLQKSGARVDYSDPHVPRAPHTRKHTLNLQSITLTAAAVARFDCAVVVTDHDDFDWELIKKNSALIIDSRGVFTPAAGKIVRA